MRAASTITDDAEALAADFRKGAAERDVSRRGTRQPTRSSPPRRRPWTPSVPT